MTKHRIAPLALAAALAGATLVGGCATSPYYDDYSYGYPAYGPSYGYNDGPFYGPAYVGPAVGFGMAYSDRDYRERDHRWHQDRDNRSRDANRHRDGRELRDGRDFRADRPDRVERPAEWRDSNGELRDREGRTAADRDRAANSASGG